MKPELRREQILRAATRVFASKGYHRASVSDIIEAAGIARGTFYLYFASKRDIFAELVDVLTVRLIGCMKRVDLSPGSPPWLEQVRANIVRIAAILAEERELTQILYHHSMGLDPEFDRKIQEFYETITRRTEAAFILGQQMGLVRKDVDPRLVSLSLVGSLKEVMYHLTREPNPEPRVEEVVDKLISFFSPGLLGKPVEKKRKKARVKKAGPR